MSSRSFAGVVILLVLSLPGCDSKQPPVPRPDLELLVRLEGEARVGAEVVFKLRLRNNASHDIVAVSHPGSAESSVETSLLHHKITGPDGKLWRGVEDRCPSCNGPWARKETLLKPGQEIDPFDGGSRGHPPIHHWIPTEPGKHTVVLSGPYAVFDAAHRPGNGEEDLQRRLAARRQIAGRVEFEVTK